MVELDALMTSIRSLREQRHDRFQLNALVQIGTADAGFRDPLSYLADPAGDAGDLLMPGACATFGVIRGTGGRSCPRVRRSVGLCVAIAAARGLWSRACRLVLCPG